MLNEAKPVIFLMQFFILKTTSNLLHPEYSIRIVNTENIILSLGDFDDEDDLEMIKATPDPVLQKKMIPFHKYLSMLKMEKREIMKHTPKLYRKPIRHTPKTECVRTPLPLTLENGHWLTWEKPLMKRKKRGKNLRKRLRRGVEFRKYKSLPRKGKRQSQTEDYEEYDYLAKDYWTQVKKSFEKEKAFRYTEEGKSEESVKDLLLKMTDLRIPENCSKTLGVGVQAVECAVKDYKQNEITTKEMMKRISVVFLIWFALYAVFAVPLWCTRGWCCCCCRCEFCQPVKVVRDIQTYVAINPPGVYVNEAGEEEHYNPTRKETELYERLTRAIADF